MRRSLHYWALSRSRCPSCGIAASPLCGQRYAPTPLSGGGRGRISGPLTMIVSSAGAAPNADDRSGSRAWSRSPALAGQSAAPSRGPFRGLRMAVYEAQYPDGTFTAGPCHPRRPWSGTRVSLHRPSRRRYMDRREMRTSALLPKLRVAPAAQLSGAASSRSSVASASMILIVPP